MKISKRAIIVTLFVISMVLVIICAIIDGNSDPYSNTTKYLKDTFDKNEYGVTIIDSNKEEDVTESFISENKELYENGDWDAVMENFLSGHYHLQIERNSDEE
ncbi:hypothetical protein [Thomasclavelia cocleata]|uniref:Uncharacterized protein n=1 Tax=Thomasclavelia cocleata TaxID=69824 RepID=A0A1I0HD70_9FIRM|nr:hypothetical protein [Thomasclavelia cocleata]MCR1960503.1 hypothetical protein [Thomasclavelia cocleata]NDO41472.1 hypothetical protein [Thomasclavelia cocleata]PJN81690.1 hypothetical protein CWE04_00770 [Thomasclavelia cocleata]SET81832.1 hypothetical protein SAMN04489758_1487 [Thomasclavelia cocleata]